MIPVSINGRDKCDDNDDQVDFLTTSRPKHPTITWPLIVIGERNVETERYIASRIKRPAIPNLTSHRRKKLHLVVHYGQAEHSFRLRLHLGVSKLFYPGRFGMF